MYTFEGSDGGTDRSEEEAAAEGEDNATAMGQLSLDENHEVRPVNVSSRLSLSVSMLLGTLPWQDKWAPPTAEPPRRPQGRRRMVRVPLLYSELSLNSI
jgi:hypothetical protein